MAVNKKQFNYDACIDYRYITLAAAALFNGLSDAHKKQSNQLLFNFHHFIFGFHQFRNLVAHDCLLLEVTGWGLMALSAQIGYIVP